ncbi:major facilitator superfamily transporter 3 [Cotesia typhae]
MAVETPDSAGGVHQRTPPKSCFAIRYLMAVMGSIGLAIIYGFKVNVSIAIVAMVNHTGLKGPENLTSINETVNFNVTSKSKEDGPFLWDGSMQGVILSAYFAGYLVSMLPGGRMSELVSAKWVMNGAVLLNVAASVLSPPAAYGHYWLFVFMRFLQGIGGGVSFPAMHVMISKWAPPNERSVLTSIIYAGTALGTVIATLLSGIIAASMGWEWVFYIEGLLCLIWCTAWWLMIEDSPEQQRRFISQEEKNYILKSLGQSGNTEHHNLAVPWGQVLKSIPFLAILVSHFCSNVGWYMMLTQLPTYMKQVLHFDLKSNTTLSSIPYLCMWFFTMAISKILAICEAKNWISRTLSRKIGTFCSSVIPTICLIIVAFAGNNREVAVTFMTIGITSMGAMYSGFLGNHIDIAPNFAGTLVAITNFFATIPGIVMPIIIGHITSKDPSIATWRIIFFITSGFLLIEVVVFSIFGSSKEESWNNVESHDEETSDQTLPLEEKNRH